MNNLFCPWDAPIYLIFSNSAPHLLYYAYLPIIIIAIFFGVFILIKSDFSLQGKLLMGLTTSFSLWVINILIQWSSNSVSVQMFSWQMTALFEVLVFIFSIYFHQVFIKKTDIKFQGKVLFTFILIPIIILLSTNFNINYFYLTGSDCGGHNGYLWNYLYIIEFLLILFIGYTGFKQVHKEKILEEKNTQTIFITIAVISALLLFYITNLTGELTKTYEINLFGPIGMVIFLGFLTFMIVKFKTFNIKLFTAQALVWGLIFMIGAQFFFIKVPINFLLTGVTFISVLFFGHFLVKGVKKEIEQREELEQLNIELQKLIKQRESLVYLITHKVKGAFTRSKYIFAEMLEGTYGELSGELKKASQKGFDSDNGGIVTVDLILNAYNLQKGAINYDMQPTDLKKIILESVEDKKEFAESKGLKLEIEIKEDNYNMQGDAFWLKEVLNNLIQNSILYTKEGGIFISLIKKEDISQNKTEKILFSIKDTGIGITEEDKKNLFTEGGRGKDSVKINVDSTGYGLYSTRLIVEAHNGKIWVESEGKGKGSTFFVEFPSIS